MKLKLLLQREPIGEILARTLSEFWHSQYGDSFDVRWYCKGMEPTATTGNGPQRWIANATLNVIFLAGTSHDQFEPIRREFSRSLVRWRQPLQSAYVALALHRQFGRFFRCGTLDVRPRIPDGIDWVIVPGNQKIRLLNRRAGRCLSVAKAGFPREAINKEVEYHSLIIRLGIPVAAHLESDLTAGWFAESLVNGTPLNRLPAAALQKPIVDKALRHVRCLAQETVTIERVGDYAHHLIVEIRGILKQGRLVDRFAGLSHIPSVLDHVAKSTSSVDWSLPISLTHGDFQPANILVQGDQLWIIDWELMGRRQAAYDLLVFQLAARFPQGLAHRMRNLTESPQLSDWVNGPSNAAYQWHDSAKRSVYLSLFVLEELQWRLRQLLPDCISATGGDIELFLSEVDQWIKQ